MNVEHMTLHALDVSQYASIPSNKAVYHKCGYQIACIRYHLALSLINAAAKVCPRRPP